MDFIDATIVRLADGALRGALFDETSLRQLVSAAYDAEALGVEGPFTPVFDEVRFAFDDEGVGAIGGSWCEGVRRAELSLRLEGGARADEPRVDALWAGAVVARARRTSGRVVEAELAWASVVGIDEEIAVGGPLPADPAQLELARRGRLIARVRARLDQPALFDDAALDRLLARLGAASVSELMASLPHVGRGASLRVVLQPFDSGPPSAHRFDVNAALMVRAADTPVALLLHESRRLRVRLRRLGFERPRPADTPARPSPTVVWVLPGSVFDDPGWPGGEGPGLPPAEQRQRRRERAGAWLAREGIGLLIPPP